MSHQPKIRFSLSATEGLTFDRWEGFIGEIDILVSSGEEMTDEEPPLLIEYTSPVFRRHGVDASRAFAEGLLVIRNQVGNIIPIDYSQVPDNDSWKDDGTRWLRGSRTDVYCLLDSGNNSLLRQMRKQLVSGSSYTLALTDQAFVMQGCFMELNYQRLQPGNDNDLISVPCDDTRIPFSVLAAAPVPRFTTSLSVTSDACCSYSISGFRLNLTVTSLHRTPVTVWLYELHCLWSAAITVTGLKPMWTSSPQFDFATLDLNFELRNGSAMDTVRSQVIFPYGGTYTSYWVPDAFAPLPPAWIFPFDLQLDVDQLRLPSWNYADTHGDYDADDRSRWPSKGVIELEPVLPGWEKIEEMLESEGPMPFFKLPRELRNIVYDYAKFVNAVGKVYLTFDGFR